MTRTPALMANDPSMEDGIEELERASRTAGDRVARALLAGLVQATTYLVLGGVIGVSVGFHSAADVAPFGYAVLVACCAIGTGRRNRTASVLLLVVTLVVEGGDWWSSGSRLALAMVLPFCPFYALGVRGAFAWHRLERSQRRHRPLSPAA